MRRGTKLHLISGSRIEFDVERTRAHECNLRNFTLVMQTERGVTIEVHDAGHKSDQFISKADVVPILKCLSQIVKEWEDENVQGIHE